MNYETVAVVSEVVSAICFVALLVWLWNKYATPAIIASQQRTNARIAQAEAHLAQAKSAAAAVQAEIETARNDATGIRERAQAQAAEEARTVEREAQEAGERAVKSAGGELGRARAAARIQYRDEIAAAALQEARKAAVQRVNAGVNEKLIANFLDSVQHGGAN